ncbi:MAG: hypothetical protein ISS01_03250 [Nanoarchaeota archaeon]|nr:hypothetical protein [Nanoarchaeota archaeon]
MIRDIAYYTILGKPVVIYLGILTYLSLITTITIIVLNKKGYKTIPFKWHPRFAILTLILATIHASLIIFS